MKNVRTLGTIFAFEVEAGNDGYLNNISKEISQRALLEGLIIRPLGNTVYIMPPFCTTEEQLGLIFDFFKSKI